MSSKWNYVFGAVTIGLIVGGTIYAIKKSKDAEKQEEQAITLEEARAIVNSGKRNDDAELVEEARIITEIEVVESKKPAVKLVNEVVEEEDFDEYEEDYEEEEIEGPSIPTVEPLKDFYYIEEGINPKEDKVLRFDRNSDDAKHQFIRMELADWEPGDATYRIILQLFEFPFIPTNVGDEILRTQVIDYKVQFFGFGSKWCREVSFADIMFHYARRAEFDCGESVQYWIDYFLQFNAFSWDSTSHEMDTHILRLNSHTYFNEERQTFGLFGLTRESMDNAIKIANRNIDRSLTYEIEFNEFLKSNL
jgi:hypothetical protein